MLRAFARKLLTQASQNVLPPNSPPLGTIDPISQYATPTYGTIEGVGPVTVTADANQVGFSPVSKCIDTEGEIAWIPVELIKNTDPRLHPLVGTGALGPAPS